MQSRSKGNAQGIDISHHNGSVDWTKIAADGIAFAFLKASEGQSYRDSTFAGHLKAAKSAGLLVGAYHFVTARNEAAARAEAANFAGAIKAAGGVELLDFPPVMDYENNPGALSKVQINAVAKAFLMTLESLIDVKPMIYTGNSFAANFDREFGSYRLWIAKYSDSAPTNIPAWSKWAFWQYSDGAQGGVRTNGSRKVAGVSGYVDLNEYAGSLDELHAEFMGDEPMTATEKEAFDALVKRVDALASKQSMSVPSWAKEAVEAAVKAKIVDTPNGGSEDFYRVLTVMHRKGLI